ncbi:DUF6236 family protein [Citrobacter freundii]|uniref:DUF6236 family protein n=1 Tax=Citrobacter freundii TaxID=546 RepID=UPI001A2D9D7B|nr:DUF6236 family protein [Citrobacter freundii]MDT7324875.1 DUF6236 family protein [Citrobacter freundii]HAT3761097.1 hypothetical protein [Citrobacter freundii]
MERGVVFSACEVLKTEGDEGFYLGKGISSLEINYLCLYWDKLVCPTNNLIRVGFNNEDELVRCGLLSRPDFQCHGNYYGGQIADVYAETHAKTIDVLHHKDATIDWRMHFLNEQINIVPELSRTSEVMRFELANLLPVPNIDVHLHEILEFKDRRKPELIALHEYLDELYFEVKRSGDFNLQRAKTLSSLKQAIIDIERLNQEVWRSPIKFSISTSFEFNLTQAFGACSGAWVAINGPHPYDILGGLGSIFSVLGGCIKILPQLQSVLMSGDDKLAYVSKGKKEGIFIK